MLRVRCPGCGARSRAPAEAAGRRRKCPQCGLRFQLTPEVAAPLDSGGPRPEIAGKTVAVGPQATEAGPRAGTVLGEYELLKKLGEGGMGTVWQARHRRLKRLVAVKMLPPQLLGDPDALARFAREMEAVGRLDHPNIVRAFDAGEADGVPFLVMEFLPGQDLARLVAQFGPLPVADACLYISQAAAGLQDVYEHGMTHRDLKPSNLMLVEAEPPSGGPADLDLTGPRVRPVVVKILDLGLAHLHASATLGQLTAEGRMMGTPDYIAPEQIETAHRVDIRADVYSLGCTLYHLLAGRPPFAGAGFMQKLAGHLHGQPQPLGELRPNLPPGLAEVVARMMAKKPADRYTAPAAVAAALRPYCAVAALLPANAGPMSEWQTLPPTFGRPQSLPVADEGTVEVARKAETVRPDGEGRGAAGALLSPERPGTHEEPSRRGRSVRGWAVRSCATLVVLAGLTIAAVVAYLFVGRGAEAPPTTGSKPVPALEGLKVENNTAFAGKWSGTWSNSQGGSGPDTLELTEGDGGVLSGKWTGKDQVAGMRTSPNSFDLKSNDKYQMYQMTGSVTNGVLTLKYSATPPAGSPYHGESTLTLDGGKRDR